MLVCVFVDFADNVLYLVVGEKHFEGWIWLRNSETSESIFAKRSFCCFSISAMAATISLLKLSRVISEILPVSYSLSRACFFFFAMSYSSFKRLNECFHEIIYGHQNPSLASKKR